MKSKARLGTNTASDRAMPIALASLLALSCSGAALAPAHSFSLFKHKHKSESEQNAASETGANSAKASPAANAARQAIPSPAPAYNLPTTKPVMIKTFDPDSGEVVPMKAPDTNGSSPLSSPLQTPSELVVPPAVPPAATGTPSLPELPQRPPVPVPPAISLIPPAGSGQPKQPLAWRTKAYKMQEDPGDGRLTSVRATRPVAASDDAVVSALVSALQRNGFVVDSIYQNAGQLLAHVNDPALQKYRIVFVLKHSDRGQLVVKAGVDPETRAVKTKTLEDILLQMQNSAESSFNNKEVL